MSDDVWAFAAATPKFVDLSKEVLFGDVWERPQLAKRDRSLATVAALVAMNRPFQMEAHLHRALDNGVTPLELSEVITHLAFYAGWPSAVTATEVLATVLLARELPIPPE